MVDLSALGLFAKYVLVVQMLGSQGELVVTQKEFDSARGCNDRMIQEIEAGYTNARCWPVSKDGKVVLSDPRNPAVVNVLRPRSLGAPSNIDVDIEIFQ